MSFVLRALAALAVLTVTPAAAQTTLLQQNGTAPVLSRDAQVIAFVGFTPAPISQPNRTQDVYVRNQPSGQVTRVSMLADGTAPNRNSYAPAISSDGRFVAFESDATNFFASDVNRAGDVFVHDRQTRELTIISVNNEGIQDNNRSFSPSMSADGRYVAFLSAQRRYSS